MSLKAEIIARAQTEIDKFKQENPDKEFKNCIVVVGAGAGQEISEISKKIIDAKEKGIVILSITAEEMNAIEKETKPLSSLRLEAPKLFEMQEVKMTEDYLLGKDVFNMKKQQELGRKHFNRNMSNKFKRR